MKTITKRKAGRPASDALHSELVWCGFKSKEAEERFKALSPTQRVEYALAMAKRVQQVLDSPAGKAGSNPPDGLAL